MSAANGIAQVVALRQLAGRTLPIHRRIDEVCAAIGSLQTATRGWPAFAPRPKTLDATIAQADAVARALRELRGSLYAEGYADAG